jgi:imidazolonepropionase-like amidohydrolase
VIKAVTFNSAYLMNQDDAVGSIEEEYGVDLDLDGHPGCRGSFKD